MEICSEQILNMFKEHDKVVEALSEQRFLLLTHRDLKFHIFRGSKRDYIVSPCRLCTCEDFVLNYIGKLRKNPCYHVVGFRIAELYNKVIEIKVDLYTLSDILEEIISKSTSFTLRKILIK